MYINILIGKRDTKNKIQKTFFKRNTHSPCKLHIVTDSFGMIYLVLVLPAPPGPDDPDPDPDDFIFWPLIDNNTAFDNSLYSVIVSSFFILTNIRRIGNCSIDVYFPCDNFKNVVGDTSASRFLELP